MFPQLFLLSSFVRNLNFLEKDFIAVSQIQFAYSQNPFNKANDGKKLLYIKASIIFYFQASLIQRKQSSAHLGD
jgi:hypothetical protein